MLTEYISSQFRNPRGVVGRICCLIQNIANKKMYHYMMKAVKADEHSTLLDIGYGNGYLIEQLFERSGAEIYGIDISEDMMKEAIKRNEEGVRSGKIKLSIGDCCHLVFKDQAFDVVTSINTIYFWQDTLQGLKEIHRTLKDGGVFYNIVYSKAFLKRVYYTKVGYKFFEKEEYGKLGKQAGFSKVGIKELSKGKIYLIRYEK